MITSDVSPCSKVSEKPFARKCSSSQLAAKMQADEQHEYCCMSDMHSRCHQHNVPRDNNAALQRCVLNSRAVFFGAGDEPLMGSLHHKQIASQHGRHCHHRET